MVDSGYVGSEQLAWSGRDWRMPVWLWVGLATMFVSVLHIIIDFGVGLFDRCVCELRIPGQSLISCLNAGWSRIGSRSESSFAFPRNSSDISIARRRCSSASVVRPVRLSQQARL
jgi:hypothetical protein